MKILVTGGAGFIGGHLVSSLLDDGHDVHIIDDMSTGSVHNIDPRIPFANKHLRDLNTDLFDRELANIMLDCDIVFHLAAVVGVKNVMKNSIRTMNVNHGTTKRILEAAYCTGTKVIFTSSSEVYGCDNTEPLVENQPLVIKDINKKRHTYACSKMLNEFMALSYYKERGVPVVVVRLFNTVGPRQSPSYGMVVPSFVKNTMNDEPLTVHGDGSQQRSFIHVHDTVRALRLLAESENAVGEVVNIGNPDNEISIRDLADYVGYFYKDTYEVQFVPYDRAFDIQEFDDIKRRVPDVSKLTKLTGFKPEHGLYRIVYDCFEEQFGGIRNA